MKILTILAEIGVALALGCGSSTPKTLPYQEVSHELSVANPDGMANVDIVPVDQSPAGIKVALQAAYDAYWLQRFPETDRLAVRFIHVYALANAADKGTGKLLGACHQTGENAPLEFDIKQK
jgi:hypothetical protein